MKKERLGNSDLQITTIGFGAWAIGGTGYEYAWGVQDDKDSIEGMHRALDLEINWIDTAAAYGIGHSEEIVARALKDWSGPRPYILRMRSTLTSRASQSPELMDPPANARIACNIYRWIPWTSTRFIGQRTYPAEIDAAWEVLAKLQREGKIRWIGVSNFNVEQMQRAQAIAPITSLQPPYSLIRREIEAEILPFCLREGIGVIVYSPMVSGLLTGAMTRERAANSRKMTGANAIPSLMNPNSQIISRWLNV